MRNLYLFWLLIGGPVMALAQHQPTAGLVRYDSVRVETVPGETEISSPAKGVRRYVNSVRWQHQGVAFSCDEVIHYLLTNRIDARGHVLMMQGDSITSTSDSARYDGTTRRLNLVGNVLFEHQRTELTTPHLDCDLPVGLVTYSGKSRLTDGPNVLTSLQGRYDTRTRRIRAYQQVALATPHTTRRSDSLWYVLTAEPTPVVDLAQAIFIDQTDLAREHVAEQRLVTAKPAGAASQPPAAAGVARLTTGVVARKTSPSSSGTFRRLPEQSHPVPGSLSTVRVPAKPVDPSTQESDLERILNRPKRVL